jgi:hypothetical protein
MLMTLHISGKFQIGLMNVSYVSSRLSLTLNEVYSFSGGDQNWERAVA